MKIIFAILIYSTYQQQLILTSMEARYISAIARRMSFDAEVFFFFQIQGHLFILTHNCEETLNVYRREQILISHIILNCLVEEARFYK